MLAIPNKESLNQAYEAASQRALASPSSYLSGFMGLTGICAGFALETAERVERAVRLGLPMNLPQEPTARTQLLEQLLVQAVFQTIDKSYDWRELRRDWDPELIRRIQERYQAIIQEVAGGIATGMVPEQGYAPIAGLQHTVENLEEASPQDHYLVVFSNPNETIYKWHVVYLHPEQGIIADGTNCLSWQSSEKTQKVFLQTAADYLKSHYSLFKEFHLLKVRFGALPATSLCRQKINFFFSTVYAIACYSLSLVAKFIVTYFLPHCLTELLQPAKTPTEEFYDSLRPLLDAGNFDAFLQCIEGRGHRIPTSCGFGYQIEENPDRFFPLLESLEKMGPHTQPISAWLQQGILDYLVRETNHPLPPERAETHRFNLRRVLQFRETLQEKYRIGHIVCCYAEVQYRHPFLEEFFQFKEFNEIADPNNASLNILYGFCEEGRLEFVQKMVAAGADPFAAYYVYPNRPIDVARKEGHMNIVHYLESLQQ